MVLSSFKGKSNHASLPMRTVCPFKNIWVNSVNPGYCHGLLSQSLFWPRPAKRLISTSGSILNRDVIGNRRMRIVIFKSEDVKNIGYSRPGYNQFLYVAELFNVRRNTQLR